MPVLSSVVIHLYYPVHFVLRFNFSWAKFGLFSKFISLPSRRSRVLFCVPRSVGVCVQFRISLVWRSLLGWGSRLPPRSVPRRVLQVISSIIELRLFTRRYDSSQVLLYLIRLHGGVGRRLSLCFAPRICLCRLRLHLLHKVFCHIL